MKKNTTMHALIGFIILLVGIAGNLPVTATETIHTIAADNNMSYKKPEVKIHPSGDIYVVYQAINNNSGRSEIYMSKYSGGNVSFVGNISNSAQHSYQPEIDITSNGVIHTAWVDESNEVHTLKYRKYNGSSWETAITFGQVTDREEVEDLRISVDGSGNVFIVFTQWNPTVVRFYTKYGNNITRENWFVGGRYKHGDIDAGPNYIHGVCQYREGGDPYTIMYGRRPNRPGASWQTVVDLNFTGTQRPRMSLDSANIPHVVFFEKVSDGTRDMYYKKWTGSSFGPAKLLSASKDESYHYCDIYAVSPDNIIATTQKGGYAGGQRVNYNWMRNGQWGGFSVFSKSLDHNPAEQSVDLSHDHYLAAMSFADNDDRVYLVLAEEGGGPNNTAPIAAFTYNPQNANAPATITFDASGSSDPDGSISSYYWNFGDGGTGSGQKPSHTFWQEGEYNVTLTVTDNNGKSASTSQTVVVEEPNLPPTASFTFSPVQGLYPLVVTFDASSSSDPDGDIVQYEWDFGGEETGSGQTNVHTFTRVGLYKVALTVYDDDGDYATATGTVNVYGLYPPLNIAYEILENRNIFTVEYVTKVSWTRNGGNADRGSNIISYKIYRKRPTDTAYSYYDQIDANDYNEYFDRLGSERTVYQYTVTGVDDQGRESELPEASTPAPIFHKENR